MKGSCSRSFKSFVKARYFGLLVGVSRFKSVRGKICCKVDLGFGVRNRDGCGIGALGMNSGASKIFEAEGFGFGE